MGNWRSKDRKIVTYYRYIFGFEESYGYLSGVFVRDKDAVNASVLICEMASHYKAQGENLLDARMDLERQYGCYRNRLLTFTFEGSNGMHQMQPLMDILRNSPKQMFGGLSLRQGVDYLLQDTGSPKSNVLQFTLEDSCTVVVRPSCTEPKIKLYLAASAQNSGIAEQCLTKLERFCIDFVSTFLDRNHL